MSEEQTNAPKPKRATFNVQDALMEKYRNAAWWERTPVNTLIVQALEAYMEELEKKNGGPYAPRGGTIARGRPIK